MEGESGPAPQQPVASSSSTPCSNSGCSISDTSGSSTSSSPNSSPSSSDGTKGNDGSCRAPLTPSLTGSETAEADGSGGNKSPPLLSSYWFSPFTSWSIWAFRFQLSAGFLYGGLVGWPAVWSGALLPYLLLRLFTLGGGGFLLLYDCLFGLRWVYTRLLLQRQHNWVQQQVRLLLTVNTQCAVKAIGQERLRLRQLLTAMRRCLSAADPSPPPPSGPCAEPIAADADAAAQAAVEGDVRMAAALYGVSRKVVASALAAARLQQAESKRRSRSVGNSLSAAAAAAAASLFSWVWSTSKWVITVALCALLVTIFADMPAAAAKNAAEAAGWTKYLYPWLLPLLHAVARGCLAAAVMNLHVGAYTELAITRALDCTCSRSSKCNGTAGCVFEKPPQGWHLHRRLLIAVVLPVVVSIGVAMGWTAASGGEMWELLDLMRIPVALLHFTLQLLPPEVYASLPLQEQRQEAAERLLMLLEQQHSLGWLQWPDAEAAGTVLLPAALLTIAVALAARCSTPPPLWAEHATLENAAAKAAVRRLLGHRVRSLQQQPLCTRIGSRCRWMWEAACLSIARIPAELGMSIRVMFLYIAGFLWVSVLLTAVSNLPLLQTEDGSPQTPMELLMKQLHRSEVQEVWIELKQIRSELDRRTKEEGYERAFEWLLELVRDTWNQQMEEERKGIEARAEALELFGLGEDASAVEIRQRYRQLAKQHHPDLAGASTGIHAHEGGTTACGEAGDPAASESCKASHEAMQRINLAYEMLLGQAGGKAAGLKHGAD